MKEYIVNLKNRILDNKKITFEEAQKLMNISSDDTETLEVLYSSANEIREKFCGDFFDLCTIINAKSGKCSEDCKYCAQSAHFKTNVECYNLVTPEHALEEAKKVEKEGAHRFSLVTSGRGLKKGDKEIADLKAIYEKLNDETTLSLCASHGICNEDVLQELFDSGVRSYHHNLETSREYYPEICTSHTYEERIDTIKAAQKVGFRVCSGGIWGLGEEEIDRLKLAFELQALDVKSVPINILMPIPGTPFEKFPPLNPVDILKMLAIYRFVLPKASIRYAGGRSKLQGLEEKGIRCGVNSALTGNFLTTTGSTIESDKEMVKRNGYKI